MGRGEIKWACASWESVYRGEIKCGHVHFGKTVRVMGQLGGHVQLGKTVWVTIKGRQLGGHVHH